MDWNHQLAIKYASKTSFLLGRIENADCLATFFIPIFFGEMDGLKWDVHMFGLLFLLFCRRHILHDGNSILKQHLSFSSLLWCPMWVELGVRPGTKGPGRTVPDPKVDNAIERWFMRGRFYGYFRCTPHRKPTVAGNHQKNPSQGHISGKNCLDYMMVIPNGNTFESQTPSHVQFLSLFRGIQPMIVWGPPLFWITLKRDWGTVPGQSRPAMALPPRSILR